MFAGNPLECASHACAYMVTKLKHGCHARGMISNPYLLSGCQLTEVEPSMPTSKYAKVNEVHPDMQYLEDALEYIPAALPSDVCVHDAALPEMNM